jgi:MoxR-like ATPase
MPDKLLILDGERTAAEHLLDSREMAIGSDGDCAIRDSRLGGRVATVERSAGEWWLKSAGAAGIELEGRSVTHARLEHGARFVCGGVPFRFLAAKAVIDRTALAGKKFGNVEEAAANLRKAHGRVVEEMASVVVGQDEVVRQVLTALFAQGHCLLVGAPGLAKTLLVRTLAGCCDLQSRRIQFTPDLMPSDITGTAVLEEDPESGRRRFRFQQGPVFTNLLLADEINRTPPKTQAALLEAMQEKRVTAAGATHDLPQPFLVMATQNPIEQEGTYPLPEAQLDRFMFCIRVEYPSADEERRILLESTRDHRWEVDRVLSGDSILQFQHLVRQVPVSPHVAAYATALVRASRPGSPEADAKVNQWVRWGAGPRAGQYLLLAAKSHALLTGSGNVSCADVRAFALPVLRHRIFTSFAAAAEGIDSDQVVKHLLGSVHEPKH